MSPDRRSWSPHASPGRRSDAGHDRDEGFSRARLGRAKTENGITSHHTGSSTPNMHGLPSPRSPLIEKQHHNHAYDGCDSCRGYLRMRAGAGCECASAGSVERRSTTPPKLAPASAALPAAPSMTLPGSASTRISGCARSSPGLPYPRAFPRFRRALSQTLRRSSRPGNDHPFLRLPCALRGGRRMSPIRGQFR